MKNHSSKFSIRKILIHYWEFARQHKFLFFSVFIFWGVGTFLFNVIMPLYYKQFVDAVTISDVQAAKGIIIDALLIMFAYTISFRLGDYAQVYFESRVIRKLYKYAMTKLTNQSVGFFASQFTGSIVAKIKRYVRSFETLQDTISFQVWFSLIHITSVIVVSFKQHQLIGMFYLTWFILFIITEIIFMPKRIRLDIDSSEKDSIVGGQIADVLSNIPVVKSFSARQRELHSFGKVADEYGQALFRTWNFGNLQDVVKGVLLIILIGGALVISFYLWSINEVTPGVIVLMITFSLNLYSRFWDFSKSVRTIMTSLTDAHEAIVLIHNPVTVKNTERLEVLNIQEGEVRFNEVSFTYDNGVSVFSNLNLVIPTGQRVGIVGHSGAGKSTITKLLLRFTDVDSGSITIDGQDIRSVTQDDLRSHITYVPQEPLLFHRTISENIGYGKDNPGDEEIISASKKAYAHDFIMRLPDGYNTLVGERGVKLSGGERQRVALARAFLKDAPILILDEATSSLDSESEHYIQESLKVLLSGKTALIIAHRLSTIQSCDRIVVFEDGKIIEDGTHEELLKNGRVYHDLWSRQAGGFINDEEE